MSINPACRYCTNYDKKRLDCKQKMYSILYSGAGIKPLCLEIEDKYKRHPFISKLRLVVHSSEFFDACLYCFLVIWGIIALLVVLVPKPHNFIFVALFLFFFLAGIAGVFVYLLYRQVYKPMQMQWKLINSVFSKEDKNGD